MSQSDTNNKIKVVIAGINGRMGRASAQAILSNSRFDLVGAFGKSGAKYVGKDINDLIGTPGPARTGILVSNGIQDAIAGSPDVLLDFSQAESAYGHAKLAIEHQVHPVVGTSGLSQELVNDLAAIAAKKNIGAMVVPNFSVGAVLMMEFARQAAKHFQNVEIVEMHHTGKIDAPSGTALHTASKIASTEGRFNSQPVQERELLKGSRGGIAESGVRIHSLRLPGLLSHQEVIFAADGELLTIRHDSFNTKCFLAGIFLALESVINLNKLVVGLDAILLDKGN
jgi:4-hydroxy-tetrahydrodipicolinate reductase